MPLFKEIMHYYIALVYLCFFSGLYGGQEPYLSNIVQLTSPKMNFTRAGEAYFSPDGQKIIFQAMTNGETTYQMFVMDLEERLPRMVSTGKGACTCGFFHPDGGKILFASSHEDPFPDRPAPAIAGGYKWHLTPYMNVYEANLDGSELVALTEGPAYHAECAYSPDGKKIVYASNQDEGMNLYVLDLESDVTTRLTHSRPCYNGGPFFSPDGSRVIFRADREEQDYLQIYVVDVDGNNERQLTFNNAVNWAPYWHPNGKVIAFATSLHGHHQYEIYLLNIETNASARLTHHASFDGLPVFNYDGTKIAWTSKRGEDSTCQIFMADFTMPPELN